MPKTTTKAKTTKKKTAVAKQQYRPSNLSVFVIVLLLVALGTVTWLFMELAETANV